jgi:hypothetical protein
MSVFNSALYLATFKPATTASCSIGTPYIYGMDYVNPTNASNLGLGGIAKLVIGGGMPVQAYDLSVGGTVATYTGVVVPGVSIQSQPACASTTAGSDGYVYGATHTTVSNVTPGAYSLTFSSKLKSPNGAQVVNTGNITLNTLASPTFIDSWAGVVE